MATSNLFPNMYDVALKPRMLRSLIKEQVPDEKQQFRSLLALSDVVSMIRNHRLLSESFPESIDPKIIESWKSAVDAWVERLLLLVSSSMPDKCWAGICLLGVTCQECSSARFVASYSVWFQKLQSHLQLPAGSCFLKAASCVSVSDLFTRLGGFPNVKKDGASHAGKLIQPLLKLLNEDSSEAVWEGAVYLICTILTIFPSCMHRHYDNVEVAVVSKIMSGKCSVIMLKKLAHCLALLPKSRGDEDSWSLLMQKILFSVNSSLNEAFQGLEEENKCDEVIRLLVPPGKEAPPPLGGQMVAEEPLENATRRFERFPTHSISSLMLCCCTMLTSSYPARVAVPVRPLLALVGRVLMVDGSLPRSLMPFITTSMQHEFICSQLPVLHSHGLELLSAIIKGVRSQLLPHAAEMVRLVIQYFRKCALPELRIKVYSIIKILLLSMGVGIAVHLSQEVISNAFVDLDGHDSGGTSLDTYLDASVERLQRPSRKKRKHVTTTVSSEQDLEMEVPRNCPTTWMSLKIAALEVLESLLTVGGALRSEHWRSKIDLLLITVAMKACKGGWASEDKNIFLPNEPISTWVDFQLAALRALLASVLSPARVRPPYLAQALDLFRRGKQETGTRLAEFCAHALLALEVLIHPRALPLMDFSSPHQDTYAGGHGHNIPLSNGLLGMEQLDSGSEDDELYDRWCRDANETGGPVTYPAKSTIVSKEPSEPARDSGAKEKFSMDCSFGTEMPPKSKQGLGPAAVAGSDVEIRENQDEIVVELSRIPEPISHEATIPAVTCNPVGTNLEFTTASDSHTLDHSRGQMALDKDELLEKGDGYAAIEKTTSTVMDSKRSQGFLFELEHESSSDSFPDIVDGDPDSD
ncbi:uncharacterized protein LOC131166320 [Malania oleifera]|uniref:uncharacterized protein LOC131166320 n=1 Tax=Malania oleifera TaxID=397392 RepID=UPI0025AE24BD|nr:uncharacterized protein LOC131166320 [Malania oleifera]